MGQDDNPLHPGWPSWRVASSHPELVDAQIQMVTIMVIIIVVTNHYGDQTLQNIIVSVVILVILAMVALVLSLCNI